MTLEKKFWLFLIYPAVSGGHTPLLLFVREQPKQKIRGDPLHVQVFL
jgi:hypothetical protein